MVNEIVCTFAIDFIDAQFHKKFEWNQLPLQFLELKNVDCHYLEMFNNYG